MPSRADHPDAPIHEIKADLFKALGHPVRVRVLELLAPGERAVSDLLAETGLEASLLSQHLAVLRRTRVVAARREGNGVTYRITHPSVGEMLTAARTFLVSTLTETRDTLDDLQQRLDRENAAPTVGPR